MLPSVEFCGLTMSRLIIGANPFGGFSHQSPERDAAMVAYHTVDRIIETWHRAAAAGINTFVTNNETEHVVQAVRQYLGSGGTMQWLAQLSCRKSGDMARSIADAVAMGCKAAYFHGALVDQAFLDQDDTTLRSWCRRAREFGIPVGVAAHDPRAHRWVDQLGIVDFHAVCGFNCGSLHAGKGHRFRLADLPQAYACIREIRKPCIAYKIMGAGRIDARLAFEYALANIKPGDVVNVGMHRGDKDGMVEENAAMVREILADQK